MIDRKTNTYRSAQRVPPDCSAIDGKPVALDRLPLFRTLWLRRGQWVPFQTLMSDVHQHKTVIRDTLRRLDASLPFGWEIQLKMVTEDDGAIYTYARLVTDELIPEFEPTGEATLPETKNEEVCISIYDIGHRTGTLLEEEINSGGI
jgi:hypothetical protein